MTSKQQALVFKITGNSTNDGPGIRSVVFLKGCPLNCVWCHNPESQKAKAELWFDKDKCIACYDCIPVCPEDAIQKQEPLFIDRQICSSCFKCVNTCPSTALSIVGEQMSAEQIVKKISDYKPFYNLSGGGVTISGGEALLFMDYTSELLKRIKKEDIHIILETSGHFKLDQFKTACLPYIDELYMDIKIIDPNEHIRLCGVKNNIIHENFAWLHEHSLQSKFKLLARIPLIPGLTDTSKNISDITIFLKKHQVKQISLLPNNPLWLNKNESLGRTQKTENSSIIQKFYNPQKLEEIKNYFMANGIHAQVQ